MTEQEIQAEYIKCLNDMRYFYNTYMTINGEPVTPVSQEQWDRFNMKFAYRKARGGYIIDRIKNKSKK